MLNPFGAALLAGTAIGFLAADAGSFIKGWSLAPALLERRTSFDIESLRKAVEHLRSAVRRHDPALWEETCYSIASHLRAGETVAQSVRAVSTEGEEFTHVVLLRVARSYDAGSSLGTSFAAEWGNYPELGQIASALDMGEVGGGDIPALLCHLAESMRKRRLARGELRSKLTEAKATAVLLSLLPWGVGLFTLRNDRVSAAAILRDSRGKTLLAIAFALWLTGNIAIFLLLRALSPARPRIRMRSTVEGGRQR